MAISPLVKQAVTLETIPIPDKLRWYDVAGQTLFPFYVGSGYISTKSIAYLIDKVPHGAANLGTGGLQENSDGRWYGVEILAEDSPEQIREKVAQAIEALI